MNIIFVINEKYIIFFLHIMGTLWLICFKLQLTRELIIYILFRKSYQI